MGRSDNVVSPLPPGAARIRDLNWPDYTTAGAAGNQPQLRCRITGAPFGGQQNVFTTFASNWNYFQNTDCFQCVGGAAGGQGGSYSWLNSCNVHVRTAPVNHWPFDDDWNVQRIVWIACVNGVVSTDNDNGLELLQSATATDGILKTPRSGFGFRYATGGKLNFIMRNTAAGVNEVTLGTNGVGGFGVTDWHSMDLRIFSALPNQPAFLQVYLDDVLALTEPWSNGRLPPNGDTSAAIAGFFPALLVNASNASGMFTKLLSFQAAPSALGCL